MPTYVYYHQRADSAKPDFWSLILMIFSGLDMLTLLDMADGLFLVMVLNLIMISEVDLPAQLDLAGGLKFL
jgi:hypothetical protein